MKNILDLTPEEIQNDLLALGEKKYRANQVFKWIHRGKTSFSEMTDLSESLRSVLESEYKLFSFKALKKLVAKDKITTKYLFLLEDNNIIETVLMHYRHGSSICLTTQVGCKMGCKFCASANNGFIRNLSSGEMVAQLLAVERDINNDLKTRSIKNIVLMGSGEPLDNFENTIKFLKLINNPLGLNISLRNVTISTCGIVPKIMRLAAENLPVTLSVSLHATSDRIRKTIMPGAAVYSIEELLKCCREYFEITGRRVTFEYAMIKGINDSSEHASLLASYLSGFSSHVNILSINEIQGKPFKMSDESTIRGFIDILKRKGISVTKRRKLGFDIDGACGQLKNRYYDENKEYI